MGVRRNLSGWTARIDRFGLGAADRFDRKRAPRVKDNPLASFNLAELWEAFRGATIAARIAARDLGNDPAADRDHRVALYKAQRIAFELLRRTDQDVTAVELAHDPTDHAFTGDVAELLDALMRRPE